MRRGNISEYQKPKVRSCTRAYNSYLKIQHNQTIACAARTPPHNWTAQTLQGQANYASPYIIDIINRSDIELNLLIMGFPWLLPPQHHPLDTAGANKNQLQPHIVHAGGPQKKGNNSKVNPDPKCIQRTPWQTAHIYTALKYRGSRPKSPNSILKWKLFTPL